MQAIADLLGETPNTISGLNHHLAEPMDTWLGRGGDDAPLRRDLVKPLREQVLAKADQTVTRAQTVQTLYHAHLAEPAKAAISQKEAIRTLIAGYRKQHQL